ncbi:MAG: DNA cytosine methyltransferase [Sulfolobales archaeon]|nr:DNA cytosine methyltransferase [Sulfolobales archaeon]MCX8198940.1 DNA cytosine methyltransferase [Sulfolobales archaeon]MDW8169918.1 DNA cytosine methyltransferase [Desulfurococcaceae archaeon]
MKPIYRVVDLFCGAGGFSLGFSQGGLYKVEVGLDNMPSVAKTYKANFPEAIVITEDIKDLRPRALLDLVGGEIDVVIGGPPCEAFTGSNPRREREPLDRLYKDPLGLLTLYFIKYVAEIRPRVFVMENVPAIMDGELKKALIKEFYRAGYSRIFFNLLLAEDYGVPSHRLRVFISNVEIKPKKINRRVTVAEALSDLPEPGASYPPNHEHSPLSEERLKKVALLRWGKALIYYDGSSTKYPNYVRLHPNKIAPTVQGSSRFIHPFENRLLTVREQARLMGFPDSFIFIGGREVEYDMVGEAVPPPLAKAIAECIAEKLRGGEVD